MEIVEETLLRTEISSAMDLSANERYMALLTRTLSKTSSMYIYDLRLFAMPGLNELTSIHVYTSYNTNPHFVKFIPGMSKIIVLTSLHLKFYDYSDGLKELHTIYHTQSVLYDLAVSPDARLVAIVGDNVRFWELAGYRFVLFPPFFSENRYCSFAKGINLIAVASPSQFKIIKYDRVTSEYEFTVIYSVTTPVENGDITSVAFNPTNAYELAFGFLNQTPKTFNIERYSFFDISAGIQPSGSQNVKKVDYFPDGLRVFSYDYLQGIGIWPGIDSKLFYKENYLLFGLKPMEQGTKLVGYVWQSLKIVSIKITCPNGEKATKCTCQNNQLWDSAYYRCVSTINCNTIASEAQNALNKLKDFHPFLSNAQNLSTQKGNGCQCPNGFRYDSPSRMCVIRCDLIPNALSVNTYIRNTCYCDYGYTWSSDMLCVFDCNKIPFANSTIISTTSRCPCSNGFVWNTTLNECVCPPYMRPTESVCTCYDQYTLDDVTQKCVLNCADIMNSIVNTAEKQQRCLCNPGYYFQEHSESVGCRLNCSAITNGLADKPGLTSCICREHTKWNQTFRTCQLSCRDIQFADTTNTPSSICECAANYKWIASINECARDCSRKKYINDKMSSTLIACPCINNFKWNSATEQCEIDCTEVPDTNNYTVTTSTCQCRPAFNWDDTSFSCNIDCKEIWDADFATSRNTCSCKNRKVYNPKTLSCQNAVFESFLSNPLAITGIVVAVVVFSILAVILLRFCWRFKTNETKSKEQRSYLKRVRNRKRSTKGQTKDKIGSLQDLPESDQRRIGTGTTL